MTSDDFPENATRILALFRHAQHRSMRGALVRLLVPCALLSIACGRPPHTVTQRGPSRASAPVASIDIAIVAPDFIADIRPILSARCAPCHEPGGKMYEKLPFDDPDVVASHTEGVLKRIDEPGERALIEGWLRAREP